MPRGTPKAIAPAVLQAIKLLADQGQSPSAVGREYGISKGRVSRIWASCEDEPAAGPAVKHEDKSTRKSGQFTVRVGKTAAAKLASSSGSSE
jgi:DNA invertase Pin-like site-specific DNA recombinase